MKFQCNKEEGIQKDMISQNYLLQKSLFYHQCGIK